MLNSLVKYLEKAFQIGCKLLFDLKEIRNIKFKWTLWLPNKKKVLNLFLCIFVLLWNGRIKLDRSFYFTRFVFKPSYPLLFSAWSGYNNADRLTAQVVNALSTLSALRQEMQLPFLSSQFRPLPSLSLSCHHLVLGSVGAKKSITLLRTKPCFVLCLHRSCFPPKFDASIFSFLIFFFFTLQVFSMMHVAKFSWPASSSATGKSLRFGFIFTLQSLRSACALTRDELRGSVKFVSYKCRRNMSSNSIYKQLLGQHQIIYRVIKESSSLSWKFCCCFPFITLESVLWRFNILSI